MDPPPSSISLYWPRLFGAKILLYGYKVAGLYDGSPPTARALNWPHCRKNEMSPISCTRWAGRRPTCIWGPTRRSERSSETSPHERPNGCIGLQNRWQVQQSATGGSGEKPNSASLEVLSTTPNEHEVLDTFAVVDLTARRESLLPVPILDFLPDGV